MSAPNPTQIQARSHAEQRQHKKAALRGSHPLVRDRQVITQNDRAGNPTCAVSAAMLKHDLFVTAPRADPSEQPGS